MKTIRNHKTSSRTTEKHGETGKREKQQIVPSPASGPQEGEREANDVITR
jgi:hypothetical protein